MNKKKALIQYWHGLGDVIMLTPLLRQLYKKGFLVDLMCRKSVKDSYLLDECKYIDKLIVVENPWGSTKGFSLQVKENMELFNKLKSNYDFSSSINHLSTFNDKIIHNFKEGNINCDKDDLSLEVFISEDINKKALEYINNMYPKGYIFNHTMIENHPPHNWDSTNWINNNLPNLPVVNTGKNNTHYMINENINFSFVLAKNAKYRVLSSSVFVHACDAMNSEVEVVNYGKMDRKVWPKNKNLIKKVRELNKWIKK